MNAGKRLLGLVIQNPGWKLLSLAIAVVVWGLVANEPEISTFATVGVEYKNLPEGLEIGSDPITTVKLELRGPSGELRDIDTAGNRPVVILDMSTVKSGDRTFAIGSSDVKLMRGVQLVRAIPSEVHFTFEHTLERKLQVTPRFRERSGYQVTDFSVNPPTISIAGPTSRVSRIETVFTDSVNVPAQAGTVEIQVNAFADDPYIRFSGDPRISVTMTVKKN
jgi:YbbR domain-containing protein